MKTMKYLFGMLLALSCSIQAMAQMAIEDGEAFYIYRNDGDFNGFFYDDVQEMRYSKIGIDSLEYDDFVVQEVVTADSIYRIPLSAIDSISFVQPEIVFNPRLKNMDEFGMDQYIINSWDCNFMLSANVPASLVPQVGDVLISFNEERFPEKGGFGGRVYEINKESDGTYYVSCNKLESLHDIFHRFITVEKVTADPQGNPVAKMAGYSKMQQTEAALSPKRKTDFSYNSDIFRFEGTLTREYKQSENSAIAASLTIGIRVGLNMVYDVDMDHIFIKTSLSEDLSAQAKFSAAFSGDWEPDLAEVFNKFGAIKFPLSCPLFETHPLPKPFFRANATLGIEAQLPAIHYSAKQMVIFSDRVGSFLNCRFSDNWLMGGVDEKMFKPSGAELSLSGFVQAGIKLTTDVTTNSWVSDFFYGSIGVITHIGPKLSGTIKCDLNKLTQGHAYESLEESKIEASLCDIDIDAEASLFLSGIAEEKEKIAGTSFSRWKEDLYLLPHLNEFNIEQNEECTNADIIMTWDHHMLLGSDPGYILYRYDMDKGDFKECDRVSQFHYKDKTVIAINYYDLKPGNYRAVPFVRLPGINTDILIESQAKDFNINYTLKLDRDEIIIPGSNNGDSVRVDVHFETNATEIYTSVYDTEVDMKAGIIHFKFPPNKDLSVLQDTIFIRGAGEPRRIYFEQSMDLKYLTAIEIDFNLMGHSETTEKNYVDGKLSWENTELGNLQYRMLLPCTVTQSGNLAIVNINTIDGKETIVGQFKIGVRDGDNTYEGTLNIKSSQHESNERGAYDATRNMSMSFTFVDNEDENSDIPQYPMITSFTDERTTYSKTIEVDYDNNERHTHESIWTYRGIYGTDLEGETAYELGSLDHSSTFYYRMHWAVP